MPPPFERPYLDTSVYISAIVREEGRYEIAAQVLEAGRLGRYPIIASTLVYAEVIKDKGHPPLDPESETKIDAYLDQPFITWVEVDLLIAKKARALSRQHGLKPVDAIHLATAIRAGCDQLLAWDADFGHGTEIEGVIQAEPHLAGLPATLPGMQ